MKITEIYLKYELPPHLADHQLTVAAVGHNICKSTKKADAEEVVTACLLHDMGNIIKFKFDKQIPGLELDNLKYWREVQQRFIDAYGLDEHRATMIIAKEIGINPRIMSIIDAIGFTHSDKALVSTDNSMIIAAYSDMRVAPVGVVSLEERLGDLTQRYGYLPDREQCTEALRKMEKLIFTNCDCKPADVTPSSVSRTKSKLASFEI